MTIREAIDRADSLKPNQYSMYDKVMWLSQLDSNIHRDILMTHEPVPTEDFEPYDIDHMDNGLLVPFPYDELYVSYLKMKTDENDEETARYNNSAIIFNAHYDNFEKYINKTQMPVNNVRLHTW